MCPADALTVESGYMMNALYQAEFINRAQMRLMHLMIEELMEEGSVQTQMGPANDNDGPTISTKYMDQA